MFLTIGRAAALGLALMLSLPSPSFAVVDVHEFENEVLRKRYLGFVEELRCPKCQNQNLAGSDSPIASDLRRELRRLLDEGRSDTEIVDFMVHRYGDYVLYKPKLKRNTLVLWGMPLGILAIGLASVLLLVRRRRQTSVVEEPVSLSKAEQDRLQSVLAKASDRRQAKADSRD